MPCSVYTHRADFETVSASFSILSLLKAYKITMMCLCESVRPFYQLFKQLPNFHEIWYDLCHWKAENVNVDE